MAGEDARDEVIAQIYEASALPELWPGALERLSKLAGCFGGALFTVDPAQHVRFTATKSLHTFMNVFIRDGWMTRNTRAGRLAPKRYAGFVTDLDLFTREEMDNDPFYYEFIRPNGGGWGTGTLITAPSGDLVVINLERAHACGPVTSTAVATLDKLRPHLARAALLSARLNLERAQIMTKILAAVGLPAAVLRFSGKLLAANDLFHSFIPTAVRDFHARVSLCNSNADKLLEAAIQRIQSREKLKEAVFSIPLPAEDERPPLIFHVLPVSGNSHDIFGSALALLIVTPVERRVAPSVDVLGGLFDLTAAEARVAGEICKGKTIASIAIQFNLSPETVRTQVRAVLQKTGMDRQVDLAALLASIGPP